MEKFQIIDTADGSNTLFSETYNAHYHSLNGALQESRHIFIESGYKHLSKKKVSILEVGLGTSFNAALTASAAESNSISTEYVGIELYPLGNAILDKLNLKTVLTAQEFELWQRINLAPWERRISIAPFFALEKLNADFTKASLSNTFDLIYFDAFAPGDQPEMWRIDIFKKTYEATNPEGILVTYCSKGIVKQALRDVGYRVERLPGPAGKRHIIRATKK